MSPAASCRSPARLAVPSQCPPCAEAYRADTYQLIRAGLTGGKGIPATVATHPCRLRSPSPHPPSARSTPAGRRRPDPPAIPAEQPGLPARLTPSLRQRHGRDDALLGEPLCPGCYDYTGTVLFNSCAPELWRRFTITLRRSLARQAGLTNKALAAQLRVSYAKVAEYQRRGVVHFHAIIRLDGPAGPSTPTARLGHPRTTDRRHHPGRRSRPRRNPSGRWPARPDPGLGTEHDIRPITHDRRPDRHEASPPTWPSTPPRPPNAPAPSTAASPPPTSSPISRSASTPDVSSPSASA